MKKKLSARRQIMLDIACEMRESARRAKDQSNLYEELQEPCCRRLDWRLLSPSSKKKQLATLKKLMKNHELRAQICTELADRIEAGEFD